MKNFKNKLMVYGSPILKEAMVKEWVNMGMNVSEIMDYNEDYYIYNNYCDKMGSIGWGVKGSRREEEGNIIHLPNDWDKCLELAAEVVEEGIEYYKYIKNQKCNRFIINKIYKGIDIENKTCYENIRCFTPSTKIEYIHQQDELLEKLIRESGLQIGDEVRDITVEEGELLQSGKIKHFSLCDEEELYLSFNEITYFKVSQFRKKLKTENLSKEELLRLINDLINEYMPE